MIEVAKSEVIVGELKKVFDADQSRTKMGRLREMFDSIEEKIEGGMSLENIRLVLEKNGLVIKLPTLAQSLCRIRKERGIKPTKSTPGDVKQSSAVPVLHNRRSTDGVKNESTASEKNEASKEAEEIKPSKAKQPATVAEIKEGLHSTKIDPSDFD